MRGGMDLSRSLDRVGQLQRFASPGHRAWPRRLYLYLSSSPRSDAPLVRERLLQTVLDRRMVVLLGAIGSMAIPITAMFLTAALWPRFWLVADLATVLARWIIIVRTDGLRHKQKERWIPTLMLLGAAWSALLGAAIFISFRMGEPALMALAGITGAATVAAVTSRNAATPRFAVLILLLITVPLAAGATGSPWPGMDIIALLMIPWFAGLCILLNQNHAILVRLIEAEVAARRLAEIDPLTGLLNRSCFVERVRKLALRGDLGGYSLLCVDLDGFKSINDSHGHSAGDAALRMVAGRMRTALHDEGLLFRFGGDEFLALIETTDPAECDRIATRLIDAISAQRYPLPNNGPRVEIGASIGSACATGFDLDCELVLQMADAALYRAKAHGKGVHFHQAAA